MSKLTRQPDGTYTISGLVPTKVKEDGTPIFAMDATQGPKGKSLTRFGTAFINVGQDGGLASINVVSNFEGGQHTVPIDNNNRMVLFPRKAEKVESSSTSDETVSDVAPDLE